MPTIKSIPKFLSFLCSLLIFTTLTGCGVKSHTNTPNSATEDKTSISSELMVAGNEIAVSVDPTVYPAAEILFKPDAKGAEQMDEHTWNIKLYPNVTFWGGNPVDAEAVIASLMCSKELDARATSFLEGIEFKAVDETTIQAVTQTPNLNVPLNLSCSQLVIHNTAEKYT